MAAYWKCRLVSAGPFVPVKTWFGAPLVDGEELDRSHRWQALVRLETSSRAILFGDETPIEVEGMRSMRGLERITESDYAYMLRHADYSTKHKPENHDAAPYTPIDWNKSKPIFPKVTK